MEENKKCECCEKEEAIDNDYCCEECRACLNTLKEYDESIKKENDKISKNDNKIMEEIKISYPKTYIKILENWEEDGGGFDLKIVNKHNGKQTDEDPNLYINQYVNGGHTGDHFEGICWYKLPNGKYLEWGYNM